MLGCRSKRKSLCRWYLLLEVFPGRGEEAKTQAVGAEQSNLDKEDGKLPEEPRGQHHPAWPAAPRSAPSRLACSPAVSTIPPGLQPRGQHHPAWPAAPRSAPSRLACSPGSAPSRLACTPRLSSSRLACSPGSASVLSLGWLQAPPSSLWGLCSYSGVLAGKAGGGSGTTSVGVSQRLFREASVGSPSFPLWTFGGSWVMG
ncbi:unnamed protein product [Rangifer tarandus platyrhynchus]|uniref:Uncharacterized protein n=1 Tax=Rangifer tarandus platyrhynchus TaxID=3082113 RepID=A0ABN8YN92_RANTA|nr:unnamed protein product [Rangifer tarandus platyrhynchus]